MRARLSIVLMTCCTCECLLGTAAQTSQSSVSGRLGIQFDAILELQPPIASSYGLMFARYWVFEQHYRVAVSWVEPHGRGMTFPLYPVTLSIYSNPDAFSTSHQVYTVNNRVYSKPTGTRGPFPYMYGDYPIGNTRFYEHEARLMRFDAEDFEFGKWLLRADCDRAVITNRGGIFGNLSKRLVNGGIAISADLIAEKGQVLQRVNCIYDTNVLPQLKRQAVLLPETPITAKLRDGHVSVTMGPRKLQLTEFPITYQRGGRVINADFAAFPAWGKQLPVPVHIQVHDAAGNRLLRSACLFNYVQIDASPEEIDAIASHFALFTPDEVQTRELIEKYWGPASGSASSSDVNKAKMLRNLINLECSSDQDSMGGKLRVANLSMDLNRLSGDEKEVVAVYKQYLSILSNAGFNHMALVGGAGLIETSLLWGNRSEATSLLSSWVAHVISTVDGKEALDFAAKEINRANCYIALRLLERLDERQMDSFLRFKREVLICWALDQLLHPEANKLKLAELESNWALSVSGKAMLQKLLKDCREDATKHSREIEPSTPNLASLKAILDAIQRSVLP